MKVEARSNIVPPGTYHAEYLEGKMIDTPKGPDDRAYLMSFRIIGGDYDDMEVSRLVNSAGKSIKSNLVKFFAALAGLTAENNLSLDDSDYVGAEYEILVEESSSKGYTRFAEPITRLADGEKADSAKIKDPF